jgi:serine/threonine protein kinase
MSDEVDLGIRGIGPATLVGRGGFGRVYRAVQASSGGAVAVKLASGHLDATGRERFEREARALGALRGHPNICTVYDAGVDTDDRPYLVMEYAPSTLAQRIAEEGAMAWADVAALGVQLAGALHTAHTRGLLHRDVKPENVLISHFGVAKLADFGLVRFTDDTLSGTITTTISHAAPELLRGSPPSVATDVYALGSTLFAALTGHLAFTLTDQAHQASLYRRIEEDPVPEMPGVPEALAQVVQTAMAKQPGDRYGSAEAMGAALQEVQTVEGVPATPLLMASEERVPIAQPALPETIDVAATPYQDADRGNLTEAVVRGDREPALVEDLAQTPAEGDGASRTLSRAIRISAGVLAALILVLVVLIAGGRNGDDSGTTTSRDTTTSESTTTETTTGASLPAGSPERIDGDWTLDSASFNESSFCDADSCTPLEALSFSIDCSSFDPDETAPSCELAVDDIGAGSMYATPGTDMWAAVVSDAQGEAQLLCGGEPVTTSMVMDLEAIGEQPVDGSAVTLEGFYWIAVDDEESSCNEEHVSYDIVMVR